MEKTREPHTIGCSEAAVIGDCLERSVTAFEGIARRIEKGEQTSAAFVALNSLGALPVMIDQNHAPLTQSLSILEFYPGRKRVPDRAA